VYAIKFEREARDEVDTTREYSTFNRDVWDWLRELATAAAERKEPAGSVDLTSIVEALVGNPFRLIGKLGARLWDWIRRRKDDRRLVTATHNFDVLGAFQADVQVTYQIDHNAKQIIVRLCQVEWCVEPPQ
jgi:hypothetical protein